ncbi:hypothetical protein O181_082421 [Austropuccinia psidii MF-1]|uniref:Uncharacterized protein n=1 Tax=Austropuccinia psidii MF-1 TaxID=1389203 RepID=A0A9Q3FSJ9_9BASI|nr:hypothetical protein [Austropuccinia psidii MF-1]
MLKVVMNLMVRKLRWFPILPVIQSILPLPILQPYNPQYPQKLPAYSFHHSYFHSSCLTQPFPHQACIKSSSQTIPHSAAQKPTHGHLSTTQTVASTSRRRGELSPLLFPAAQVFQRQDQWPIRVTREDPNMESENQDAVARLFRRVYRNSREVIM